MNATLFAPTDETSACCSREETLGQIASLRQAVEALEREVAELRCEAGYWKSRHADALRFGSPGLQPSVQLPLHHIRFSVAGRSPLLRGGLLCCGVVS